MASRIFFFMNYKFSFAIVIYAMAALIDAVLGTNIQSQPESYILRAASAITVIAAYLQVTSKNKPLRPLIFILASLALSIILIAQGRIDFATTINLAIKVTGVILTIKPEIIEIEVITEEEESIHEE